MKTAPARLDADRTARPLTRLVAHVRAGDCIGPGSGTPFALETVATGERISLTPTPPPAVECNWCGCTKSTVAGYLHYCNDCGCVVGSV